jgi:hypothetical protein
MEVEETVQQAEAIFRFATEVDRRLAEQGIRGVDGLVGLFSQFRRALGTLTQSELDWATGEADRLAQRLRQVCTELQQLSALKDTLEARH